MVALPHYSLKSSLVCDLFYL
uniref:Uncharacterized protein n=1 Tax=Anguilla anguilla TaxID=7936 RepID=A0A0E9QUB0_ANGAN